MAVASGVGFIMIVLIAVPIIAIIVIALSKNKDSGMGMKISKREKAKVKVISKRTEGSKNYVIFELVDGARIELVVKSADFADLREGDSGTLDYNGIRFNKFEL